MGPRMGDQLEVTRLEIRFALVFMGLLLLDRIDDLAHLAGSLVAEGLPDRLFERTLLRVTCEHPRPRTQLQNRQRTDCEPETNHQQTTPESGADKSLDAGEHGRVERVRCECRDEAVNETRALNQGGILRDAVLEEF